MIEFTNVKKYFHIKNQDILALNQVSFKVPTGSICGILGKSGAGKSTLLRCANLLERPSSGSVCVAGRDLMALSADQLRALRKKIGMIFQHFNLLDSLTAYDNIALPLRFAHRSKAQIHKKVTELLALVGLSDRAEHFPNELSGGQKQRVAIARALATEPQVLLCDEATSALDPQATASILGLLQKINKQLGITLLLITHELDVVKRICHQVGVMHQGQLVEFGSVLEVFSKPKHDVTRELIYHQHHHDIEVENRKNLVRLTFIGSTHDQPLISQIVRLFDVDANILQADIESIESIPIGTMLCKLQGEPVGVEKALAYLLAREVKVEVLS